MHTPERREEIRPTCEKLGVRKLRFHVTEEEDSAQSWEEEEKLPLIRLNYTFECSRKQKGQKCRGTPPSKMNKSPRMRENLTAFSLPSNFLFAALTGRKKERGEWN